MMTIKDIEDYIMKNRTDEEKRLQGRMLQGMKSSPMHLRPDGRYEVYERIFVVEWPCWGITTILRRN